MKPRKYDRAKGARTRKLTRLIKAARKDQPEATYDDLYNSIMSKLDEMEPCRGSKEDRQAYCSRLKEMLLNALGMRKKRIYRRTMLHAGKSGTFRNFKGDLGVNAKEWRKNSKYAYRVGARKACIGLVQRCMQEGATTFDDIFRRVKDVKIIKDEEGQSLPKMFLENVIRDVLRAHKPIEGTHQDGTRLLAQPGNM